MVQVRSATKTVLILLTNEGILMFYDLFFYNTKLLPSEVRYRTADHSSQKTKNQFLL